MRLLLAWITLLIGLSVFGQADSAYDAMLQEHYKYTIPFIQPEELHQKITQGANIVILDTRESKESKVSGIYGAKATGFLFFSAKDLKDLPKDQEIIVYCTIGARSETIGNRLRKKGFTNVSNLYGGIIYWKNMGYPVYDSQNNETEEIHVYSKKWGRWLKKGKAIY